MWVGIVEVSVTKVIEPYVDIDTLGLIQCNGREKRMNYSPVDFNYIVGVWCMFPSLYANNQLQLTFLLTAKKLLISAEQINIIST